MFSTPSGFGVVGNFGAGCAELAIQSNDITGSSGDDAGYIEFYVPDSVNNLTEYSYITGRIITATNGIETGALLFNNLNAGVDIKVAGIYGDQMQLTASFSTNWFSSYFWK